MFSYEELDKPLNWPETRETAKQQLDGEPHLRHRISRLTHQIDLEMNKRKQEESNWKGCFIKSSLRSPKDVPVRNPSPACLQLFEQEIRKLEEGDHLGEMKAFSYALGAALLVTSGQDAVQLLIQSQRICEDCKKLTQFGRKSFEKAGGGMIVLREWQVRTVGFCNYLGNLRF